MTNLSELIDKHCPRPSYVQKLDATSAKRLQEEEEARKKEVERLEKLKQQRLARQNGEGQEKPEIKPEPSPEEVANRLVEVKEGKSITVADIKLVVAEEATILSSVSVTVSQFESANRARSVARPRQVAMYIAKMQLGLSLPQIGRRFGNRDHTTVMHAVKKINELRVRDRFTIDLLKNSCTRLGTEVPPLPK